MLGFVTSFVVFIKAVVPHTIMLVLWGRIDFEEDPLPIVFGKGVWTGQIYWATVYCFLILLPISLA